jgi:hypothetical protein
MPVVEELAEEVVSIFMSHLLMGWREHLDVENLCWNWHVS